MESGRAAAARKAKDEVSHLLRGVVRLMTSCVRKHIAHTRASVNVRSSMDLKILRSVEGEVQHIVCSQSVLGDGSLEVSRVLPSRDLLLLPCVDAARDGDSWAMPASYEVQVASSSRSEKDLKTPLIRSTNCRKKFTTRTRSDAAKASVDDIPVVGLENDPE